MITDRKWAWAYTFLAVSYYALATRKFGKVKRPFRPNTFPLSPFISHPFRARALGSYVCECGEHLTIAVHCVDEGYSDES